MIIDIKNIKKFLLIKNFTDATKVVKKSLETMIFFVFFHNVKHVAPIQIVILIVNGVFYPIHSIARFHR